ncbi:MAG: RNA polymerase sigma factor, partial [Cyclobacteriaceae bacterium]|nr:RNA polymerase sigma factor [Cyclobacteriaceae bacterium]
MNNIELSDSKLVSLYIKGNEESFEVLLNRYKSNVFTNIYLIVKDTYIAEDLTQDTFIKAIKTLRSGRYNEEGKFKPWILRIAHNLAIDYFRRKKRYPTIVMEDGSNVFNTLEFSEAPYENFQVQEDTKKKLRSFIDELPENQREVILMRHYQEMSFQDIAES